MPPPAGTLEEALETGGLAGNSEYPARRTRQAWRRIDLEDQSSGPDFGGQIRDLARVLREQWWIVAICVALAAFAAAAYTGTQDKKYEASAKLLLQTDNLSSTIAGASIPGVDPTRQTATDAQLAALPAVARRVSAKLKEPLAAAAVRTSAGPDSNIIGITVTDSNPRRAARFANAFANQYILFRRDTTRQRYARALRTVQTRLAQTRPGTPDAATLGAQAKQLKLLVSLQTGDAQVVQAASPPAAASSPDPARNIAVGAVAGLLLGLGLAFLRDRLDRRLKSERQLATLLPNIPIIGLVPEPGRRRVSQQMTAEAFHSLQANLALLSRARPLKTLLITSATPEEGKSTVALNLGLAMKEKGQQALVLDADLRRPSLSQRVKADRRVGVSRILAGEASVGSSVQERP